MPVNASRTPFRWLDPHFIPMVEGPGTPNNPTVFHARFLSPRYEFGPAVSFDPEVMQVVTLANKKENPKVKTDPCWRLNRETQFVGGAAAAGVARARQGGGARHLGASTEGTTTLRAEKSPLPKNKNCALNLARHGVGECTFE